MPREGGTERGCARDTPTPRPPRTPVSSSPLIDGLGSLYFSTTFGTVYSLNASGAPRWTAPYAAGGGAVSSPALAPDGSRVYVASAWGSIVALNASTGATLWTVYVVPSGSGAVNSASFRSTPAVSSDGSALYVVNSINTIIALDLVASNALPLGTYASASITVSNETRAGSTSSLRLILWGYDMGYTRTAATAAVNNAGANDAASSVPFESSPVSHPVLPSCAHHAKQHAPAGHWP